MPGDEISANFKRINPNSRGSFVQKIITARVTIENYYFLAEGSIKISEAMCQMRRVRMGCGTCYPLV